MLKVRQTFVKTATAPNTFASFKRLFSINLSENKAELQGVLNDSLQILANLKTIENY